MEDKDIKNIKLKVDRIWGILKAYYVGITKEPELDTEQFLKLEEEYYRYSFYMDMDLVTLGKDCVEKRKLCGFIEYYYRLKMAANDFEAVKEIIHDIAGSDRELKNILFGKISERMDDEEILAILRYVAAHHSHALSCGVVVEVLDRETSREAISIYHGLAASLNDSYSRDNYDIDDDISEYDDGFSNDRFGYDSESFDFDMDGFDDHFD